MVFLKGIALPNFSLISSGAITLGFLWRQGDKDSSSNATRKAKTLRWLIAEKSVFLEVA